MNEFWIAFLPLFVALDGGGLLPIFWALTVDLDASQRRRVVTEAVGTAFLVTLIFLLGARAVFSLMGLELGDVMVGGGLVLIVLCLRDLLLADLQTQPHIYKSPGVVPLGVPLLAGPAVLTTVILVRDQHGWGITIAALSAGMFTVWAILSCSDQILKWVGKTGSVGISKVFSLILTAYGVMLIRRGIAEWLSTGLF